jgi:hypothetical protein
MRMSNVVMSKRKALCAVQAARKSCAHVTDERNA